MSDRELIELLRKGEGWLGNKASQAIADRLEAAERQRDELSKAIANAASSMGIWNGDTPLSGPHLLMFCEDMASHAKEVERQRDEALAEVERMRGLLWRAKPWLQELCHPQTARNYAEQAQPLYHDVCDALARHQPADTGGDNPSVILDEIALALETRGYAGMANALLDQIPVNTGDTVRAKEQKLNPELERLLELARQNPPSDAELREQAVSWVRGELRMANPDLSYEEADQRARKAATREGE